MSDKNIQEFDGFFREAFNSFEPEAPGGVWQGVQSQIGAQAGGAAGAATGVKAVLAKIIVSSVAVVTVVTGAYFIYTASNENKATPETTTAQPAITTDKENTQTDNTTTSSGNESQTGLSAGNNTVNSPVSAAQGGNQHTQSHQSNTSNTGAANGSQPAITAQTGTGNNSPIAPDAGKNESSQLPAKPSETNAVTAKLALSGNEACVNEKIQLSLIYTYAPKAFTIDFGDGTVQKIPAGQKTLEYSYKRGGDFSVKLIYDNKAVAEQSVKVQQPKAAFTATSTGNASYRFDNTSTGAVRYLWYFGDNTELSSETTPTHIFRSFEPREYRVKLLATSSKGCVDSFAVSVKNNYTYDNLKPKVHNAFSPNGDRQNDEFDIDIENEDLYQLVVMSPSGQMVFKSNDKNVKWNGKNMETGELCLPGTYYYFFTYRIKGFEERKESGTVDIFIK